VKAVEAKRAAAPAKAPAAAAPAKAPAAPAPDGAPNLAAVDPGVLKETFLGEVRKAKKFFYGTVVAQAQKIEFEGDKVVFTFTPQHRALRAQLEQNRPWLESAASQLSGKKMSVVAAEGQASAGSPPSLPADAGGFGATPPAGAGSVGPDRKDELKQRAMADTGVQTMLDVFAAEIKDVEEM
jgi:hypothetical protein